MAGITMTMTRDNAKQVESGRRGGQGLETDVSPAPGMFFLYTFIYYAIFFSVYITTIYCDTRMGGNPGDEGRGLRHVCVSSPRYIFIYYIYVLYKEMRGWGLVMQMRCKPM